MNTTTRKKSPRAPSMSLQDAIEKTGRIYEKERCHTTPVDVAATHIGYKSATNGAALSTLASLKYFGLIDRPKDGMAAVSKEFEEFRFAPNETIRQGILTKWLKSPAIFAELLDKYPTELPSNQTLKYELIQSGFAPQAADVCLEVFRESVDYAQYYKAGENTPNIMPVTEATTDDQVSSEMPKINVNIDRDESNQIDRIPVRLSGGRRAWIEIPTPFYIADKERLKKQIDLLLTEDEDDFNEDL